MNHRGFHRVVQRFAALATGVASAVGRYEDDLVKRDGSWFIAKRRRIE